MKKIIKKKVLIFGSSGGIGKFIKKKLEKKNYKILSQNSKSLNFLLKNPERKIKFLLERNSPDIIINASGILGKNNDFYSKVFSINFMPNWEIVKYYLKKKLTKKVLFIMVGSSSYKKGKKDYMLYSSSKAALHNLYQAVIQFHKKNFIVKICNLTRVKTKMIKNIKTSNKKIMSPIEAANKICRLIS